MSHAVYTVEQVQDRIEELLGERPTAAAIHLEGARGSATPNARVRITAGLPAPINPGGRPLRYPAGLVEAWLDQHPRVHQHTALHQLGVALRSSDAGSARKEAVRSARAAGLSWAQVAATVADIDGRPITRQAVAKRFGA